MPVYHYRSIQAFENSLIALADIFFSKMPLILTDEEFISAFINPEHVPTLESVAELVGHIGMAGSYSTLRNSGGQGLGVELSFGGRAPILLPKYIVNGIQPTCPNQVAQKLQTWVDERISYGIAFGTALDAIYALNDLCHDARAMSIMLPCLPYIMGEISEDPEATTSKRAQSLQAKKSVPRLPKLPPQVKARLQEVAAIVNSVSLMKDAKEPVLQRFHAKAVFSSYASDKSGHPSEITNNLFDEYLQPSGSAVRYARFM